MLIPSTRGLSCKFDAFVDDASEKCRGSSTSDSLRFYPVRYAFSQGYNFDAEDATPRVIICLYPYQTP